MANCAALAPVGLLSTVKVSPPKPAPNDIAVVGFAKRPLTPPAPVLLTMKKTEPVLSRLELGRSDRFSETPAPLVLSETDDATTRSLKLSGLPESSMLRLE